MRTYFIDRTEYFGNLAKVPLRHEAEPMSLHEARERLARVLRQIRSDYDLVVIRDRGEDLDKPRQYFITNTVGPRRFERTIRIERA